MNKADKNFIDAMNYIFENGVYDENPRPYWLEEDGSHTPAHTLFAFDWKNVYDLSKGEFPFMTLRPMPWKTGIKETLWIFQDQSNDIKLLEDKYNVNYWQDWNVGDGTIGYRYGHTVKRYDLMNNLIEGIKTNPYGRRHILSLWQNQEFMEEEKGLNPCCFMTIWNVMGDKLNMKLIQRSSDHITAGSAINEIQYCALLLMVAKATGYKPGLFVHDISNIHIYDRHIPIVKEVMKREPIECQPKLILDTDKTDFYSFTIDDFKLEGYPLDEIKKKNPQVKLPLAI